MNDACIGVFDSGLGGLTCVKELAKIMPSEKIIYFGDTGRVPYGSRSVETITKYTQQDIDFLVSKNVKLVIAACGTASSVALDEVTSTVPLLGVVEPAARAAAEATKNGCIGVLGTNATISRGRYEKELYKINPNFKVISRACPLFVPLVENGYFDSEITYLAAKEYLVKIKEAGADTIILGCTHYPLISGVIRDIMGNETTLINSGAQAARAAKELLEKNDALATSGPQYSFYVSDAPNGFDAVSHAFLGGGLTYTVEKVTVGD